ncbi:MAG TPA: hypothetical protein VJ824_16295, partial [Bacillota bacterium]|nr:hypothetical protein [Bacillota bacterium]
LKWESYGNSIALYIFLVMAVVSIWSVSPLPGPKFYNYKDGLGATALIFVGITVLHGLLWWILTREFLPLKPVAKRTISGTIRLIRPLHIMTGFFALGFVFLHAIAYFKSDFNWEYHTMTGIIALITFLILALDGIGLMVSPFLSRKIHRFIALAFICSLVIHLL